MSIVPERIILGIDPGTNIMGYGIISCKGTKMTLVTLGIVDMQKMDDPMLKLQTIFNSIIQLIETHHPDELAIEAPFFGKNVQSMLKLGRAQGVAIAAALSRQLSATEYAPTRVKQSITGRGAASKEQVAAMLQNLLSIKDMPAKMDATDGLAVAVCHFFQNKPDTGGKSYTGWKAFITQNPERAKK